MTQERLPENKMGVMPVNTLLLSMAIPIMISMLVQALYNVVDSVFVSRISENALTAVSLAFPAQNLMISVATGTGVGVNALLSKSLGQKRFDRANKAANHAVFLALISYLVFAILGVLFSRQYFLAQTDASMSPSDIEEIVNFGTQYLVIVTVFSIGMFGQITFERLLQSTGKTVYSMITQIVGAVLNIIFDPILIFGLFGFPKMGIAGAAVATVFGQIVAFLLGIYINATRNKEITLSLKSFSLDFVVIKKIYAIAVPSIIMVSISSIMTFFMNKILIAFTPTATAVFGVYFKLQSFVFMPVFGLNNGMVPIVAYNLGAKKSDRIVKTIKLGILYATIIMLIGLSIFQFIPDTLLNFFDASASMLEIGMPALRIISLSFIFAGFSVICSSLFQSLGHGMLSLWLSLLRQLVVLLPLAYFFAQTGNLYTVWYSFPLAEIVSLIITALCLRHVYHKEIAPLKDSVRNEGHNIEK